MEIIIPEELEQRAVEAICRNHNYNPEILSEDGSGSVPNPESEREYAERMIQRFVRGQIEAHESQMARETISKQLQV